MLNDLNHVAQVSDRCVIDQIFHIIDSTVSARKLRLLINLIQNFVENDTISLLEVHKKITYLKNISSNDRFELVKKNSILKLLLRLSCFQAQSTYITKKNLFTEAHVEDEFKKEIQKHHRNSTMFLRGLRYLHPILLSDCCTTHIL